MVDASTAERIRTKADQRLRRKSQAAGGVSCLLSVVVLVLWGTVWATWLSTPLVQTWVHDLFAQIGVVSVGTFIDNALKFPSGTLPYPLIVMFASWFGFQILNSVVKSMFNYVNYSQVDTVRKAHDAALQRETDKVMRSEGLAPSEFEAFVNKVLTLVSTASSNAENLNGEVDRRFAKIRRWFEMYNQIPDEPELKVKNAEKVKRDQTVRLSDDGELIYEDEEPIRRAASRKG